MGILEKIFKKTAKVDVQTTVVSGEQLVFDKEQEYKDLSVKHSEFFENKNSPKNQMQSNISELPSNIEDITPSKSDIFFQNAPGYVLTKESEEIVSLKKYMGVPTEREEWEDFLESGENEIEALITLQSSLNP